jgi:CRISPR-associated protein Cmr1
MPKSDDVAACPRIPVARSTGLEARDYSVELITPLFGGGVEPRRNDTSFPIRPTSIRGQLEFWWRATVGAQYPILAELRAAQSDIWGSTERASRVDVLVDDVRASETTPCARIEWNPNARQGRGAWRINWQAPFNGQNSSLSYALFPFQGETPAPKLDASIDVPPATCIQQASFRLIIRCPKNLWPHVEPAVWAWVNFGGLGGRARRGCGAISCGQLAPRDRNDLIECGKRLVQSPSVLRDWPTLAAAILIGSEQPKAIAAWADVIGRFRQFRQGVGLGRNAGQQQNRPGRSRWPEPETLRELTKLNANRQRSGHQRWSAIPSNALPRAELGLPIVFHFQGLGEPQDTVLYPADDADGKKRERMASSLILRPLVLANGKAVPLIVRLKTPDLAGVDLRQKVQGQEQSLPLPNPTLIRGAALAGYTNSPLAGSPNGSALEAFLALARSQGFQEVT